MHKAFLVAQREYLENVKTKGFWIGILLFPVMLTLFIVVPTLLDRTRSARRYAVVDRSGWLLREMETRVIAGDLARVFRLAAAPAAQLPQEGAAAELPRAVRDLAPRLAEVDGERLVLLAAAVAAGAPAGVEGELVDSLLTRREELLSWWRGLQPAAARRLGDLSRSRFVRVSTPVTDDTLAALNRMIAQGELFAYFVIGPDPVTADAGGRYVSNNLTDQDLKTWFSGIVGEAVRARRLLQEGIDPAVAAWIQEPLRFEERKVTGTGQETAVEARDTLRQWAPVVFVYLLWISVFAVSQMLLTNTVEEKSNRTIEVLLSSVSPLQLMAGKIGGIAATGLTVVASWIVFFALGTKVLPRALGAPPTLDLSALATDPLYIGSFVGYFFLGYLLYAAILVGIGSVVNTLKEAQNLMTPVTLLLVTPLLAMVPIGRDPNGTLAQVLSYIPPFTPFVMMNRAAGPPAPIEYVLTTALLLVSIAAALWAAAKVFRVGILLTGKPPRPGEILKWIRSPVGSPRGG